MNLLSGESIDSCPDSMHYADCTYLVSHNAFTIAKEGWFIHAQQSLNITEQFNYGVRAFMIDVHSDDTGKLLLKHCAPKTFACGVKGVGTSANGDVTLESFFKIIDTLLRDSSHILTIFVENYARNEEVLRTAKSTIKATNFLSVDPNTVTRKFMKEYNQRLVIFSDKDDSAIGIWPPAFYKETTYSLSGDTECIDRQESRAKFDDGSVSVFIVNHFLALSCQYQSTQSDSSTLLLSPIISYINPCDMVNSYEELARRVTLCGNRGLFPTFVGVDFVQEGVCGGARKLVQDLNSIGKAKLLNSSLQQIQKSPVETYIYVDESIYKNFMWSIHKLIKDLYNYIISPITTLLVAIKLISLTKIPTKVRITVSRLCVGCSIYLTHLFRLFRLYSVLRHGRRQDHNRMV